MSGFRIWDTPVGISHCRRDLAPPHLESTPELANRVPESSYLRRQSCKTFRSRVAVGEDPSTEELEVYGVKQIMYSQSGPWPSPIIPPPLPSSPIFHRKMSSSSYSRRFQDDQANASPLSEPLAFFRTC